MPHRPQPSLQSVPVALALVASLSTMAGPARASVLDPSTTAPPASTPPSTPSTPAGAAARGPAGAGVADTVDPAASPAPPPTTTGQPASTAPASPSTPAAASTGNPAPPAAAGSPPAAPPPTAVPPTGGGVAGSVTSSDDVDPAANTAEIEGDLIAADAATGQTMQPLQAAGWWTMFGAVALATTGGVFVGMMANEEDKAFRLAVPLDQATGRHRVFGTVQAEYEEIYARGEKFEKTAHALLISGGVTAIVSTVLLAVHAGREKRASRVAVTATGLELTF